MTGLWIAIGFVLWYSLALVISEKLSEKSRLSKQWLFFISFVFSPLVGFVAISLVKK